MNAAETPNTALVPNYRVLKAVVILLGALILLAFGALVAGMLLGVGPRTPASRVTEPYNTRIATAPGARLAGAELVGNRLLVRVEDGNGGAVVIVDAASGRMLGRVMLQPGAD